MVHLENRRPCLYLVRGWKADSGEIARALSSLRVFYACQAMLKIMHFIEKSVVADSLKKEKWHNLFTIHKDSLTVGWRRNWREIKLEVEKLVRRFPTVVIKLRAWNKDIVVGVYNRKCICKKWMRSQERLPGFSLRKFCS